MLVENWRKSLILKVAAPGRDVPPTSNVLTCLLTDTPVPWSGVFLRSWPDLFLAEPIETMTDSPLQPVKFSPERYRREATTRVCRKAEATENETVRRQLLEIARQFDPVAETTERSGS